MIKSILVFTILISLTCFSQEPYQDSVQNLRKEHISSILDSTAGVLNGTDLEHLDNIHYFPISNDFIVNAEWKKKKGKRFKMPTSTERTPVYKRHGYINFEVGDSIYTLTVYRNMKLKKEKQYKNYFFIPFRDETSGITSYGGGRYLDISLYGKEKKVKIDFNLAYNPYCAYSHRYSCPIPPSENTIEAEISAGEKTPTYK